VRKRNLAVGFGVLALLAVAIAVMLIALRRAQILAQLQLEFVAGVSHELRTPLSVIRSAGENLADGVTKGPESVRRYGALVRDEGRRLSEMVEQILAFARTSSAFERQPVE
jgi:signal transduction histidine kinase